MTWQLAMKGSSVWARLGAASRLACLSFVVGCMVQTEDDDDNAETGASGSTANASTTGDCACTGNEQCGTGEICVSCVCVASGDDTAATCTEYGPGLYGDCVNDGNVSACGDVASRCLVDDVDFPSLGVCSPAADCTSACDCPAPPADGTAVPACDADVCVLSCVHGENCPAGMACWLGICVFGNDEALSPYGDCLNDLTGRPCGLSTCASLGGAGTEADPLVGMCFPECTGTDDVCPAAPGDVPTQCLGFYDNTGATVGLCTMNCADTECPAGMVCYELAQDRVCLWPFSEDGTTSSEATTTSGTDDAAGSSEDGTTGGGTADASGEDASSSGPSVPPESSDSSGD